MANLTKSRTLFGFTSPRTIEKIIPEIKILIENFDGQVWSGNEELQSNYFMKLFESDFYDGDSLPNDKALAARDRITRAPKALGFVDLKPIIKLTEAGNKLLYDKRPFDIITKQLLKFQLPSPYHTSSSNYYFIKPYLELLRLINTLGSLSKTEISLFFIQLRHINDFEKIVSKITTFRKESSEFKGNRKFFKQEYFKQEIIDIYSDEIKSKNIKTRESEDDSLEKFIKTKKANMNDYADAFIRYLRATELITFQKKTFRVIIANSKKDEVDFILSNIERKPAEFKNQDEFKKYLFSSNNISLLGDNRILLTQKLTKLGVIVKNENIEILKDLLEERQSEIIKEKIEETKQELKGFKEFDDIIETFNKIIKKQVPDPPLYLEWNVWRAMVMLNFAKSVIGNFSIDLDGMPLNTALGNKPDIEIEYDNFKLIMEVTMSSGNKQYEMEGEPVARHYGKIKQVSTCDVYCIFIAPIISEGTLAHYFNLNKMNTKYYGGKTKIVPFKMTDFINFIKIGKEKTFSNPEKLKKFLDDLLDKNQKMEDEIIWLNEINKSIETWAS